MHIHCFQHAAFEDPGTILHWAAQNGHTITYTYFFEADYNIPPVEEIENLLVLGGAMNVDEEEQYPWLKTEKQTIRKVIDAGKKVMGICLGSQLIAAALGKAVYKGKEKEIGFFPVTFTQQALAHKCFNHFTKEYTVFNWHGDTFDLADDAILIASSINYPNQAFIIGNQILALQFHFEMNETSLKNWQLEDCSELLEQGAYIQNATQITAGCHYLTQNKKDIFLLLDKFFTL